MFFLNKKFLCSTGQSVANFNSGVVLLSQVMLIFTLMKTSLSHLPERHQSEILQICEKIKEIADPEKIILFGSYAKGTPVDDTYFEDGIRYHYISDYDFLVIPKDKSIKEYIIQDKIINTFRGLETPINIIAHDIDYVNEGLSEAQYFFTDILSEGVLLHDRGNTDFLKTRELTGSEKKTIAERYFNQWYKNGSGFLKGSGFYFKEGQFNLAAFELHQAAENFYNTTLLVFTGYKPKTHNLEKLRQYAKNLSEELFLVFPFPAKEEKDMHLFELLKRGYIDARYKEDYSITESELMELTEKIEMMQAVVQKICLIKISSFL